MLALGIESTAHTFGVGIMDDEGRVLSNVRRMYKPPKGGIHPRAAAEHHTTVAAEVMAKAFADADETPAGIDLVAFSQGPGLGPCLRTGATAARVLALKYGKPLVGVNHCVAHLEIGRQATGLDDPILLYASGGNTQVISFTAGRYRVHGETLDIGVGNFLDKFAREIGLPFPGGPEIEKIARGGDALLDLPYTVKGMDVAFSGLLTAALALRPKARMEDLCYSVQETAFAMLCEVTERAMAHVGKSDVVLGGGVACNERLRDMVDEMCSARGASCGAPTKDLLVDNGAMIAWAGLQKAIAGEASGLGDSGVRQRFRTDEVDATWRPEPPATGTADPWHGAEAVVTAREVFGRPAVAKTRAPKGYRHFALDRRLRTERARAEARLLKEARDADVPTPSVLEVDTATGTLVLSRIDGPRLRDAIPSWEPSRAFEALRELGRMAGRLHGRGIVHGDLTTSNVLVDRAADERLVLIDFGLGFKSDEMEPKAVDLHVTHEALAATHAALDGAFDAVTAGYRETGDARVLRHLADVEERGRYK